MSKIYKDYSSITIFPIFFIIFKSLTFIVPILLLNQLSHKDYVIFESGLAISNIVVIIANLGVSAAIPLYILKENKSSDVSYIYLHSVTVSILMIFIAVISSVFFNAQKLAFISIVVSILCNLRVISSHKKALSMPLQASFFEAYLFMILLICIFLGATFITLNISIINLILFLASILLIALSVHRTTSNNAIFPKIDITKCKELYSFSSIALVSSVAIIFIITLLRAIGDELLTTEQYIAYSTYFRLSSIAIIAFQFILTLKFKDIYTSPSDSLDKKISHIVFLILSITFIIYCSQHITLPLFFNNKIQLILKENTHIFLPIIIAMPLWATSAVLENIISRERAFKQMLLYLSISAFIFFIIFFSVYLTGHINFTRLIYSHVLLLSCLIFSQLLALYNLNIILKRTYIIIFIHFILGVSGASFSS